MAIADNEKVVLVNEGHYTVYLNNSNSGKYGKSRIIPPQGKLVLPFEELRDAVYAESGNREIISQYIRIDNQDVREELGIGGIEIIDDKIMHQMLHLTSSSEINNKFKPFLEKLGPGQLDRIAQMAVDEKVADVRITTLLQKYTPYKNIANQITEGIEEEMLNSSKE